MIAYSGLKSVHGTAILRARIVIVDGVGFACGNPTTFRSSPMQEGLFMYAGLRGFSFVHYTDYWQSCTF